MEIISLSAIKPRKTSSSNPPDYSENGNVNILISIIFQIFSRQAGISVAASARTLIPTCRIFEKGKRVTVQRVIQTSQDETQRQRRAQTGRPCRGTRNGNPWRSSPRSRREEPVSRRLMSQSGQ